jgi:hypothetical protein
MTSFNKISIKIQELLAIFCEKFKIVLKAILISLFNRVQGTKTELFTRIMFTLLVERAPCPQNFCKFDKIPKKKIFTSNFFHRYIIIDEKKFIPKWSQYI